MTTCVIVQPSYIPWRGYFDLIHQADVFVFLDDVQYDTRGWRNRNRVKTPQGTKWLTIPVKASGAQIEQIPINRIETAGDAWARKHLINLEHFYARAPHFAETRQWLHELYASPSWLLADFTVASTMAIAARLGITGTRFVRSSERRVGGAKTDRLIAILRDVGADRYLSGPAAKAYIEPEKFDAHHIELQWMVYEYPEYEQLHPPYDPFVSVLDLIFMKGEEAPRYIWDV